jgi:hypothetical protein
MCFCTPTFLLAGNWDALKRRTIFHRMKQPNTSSKFSLFPGSLNCSSW